MTNPRNLVNDEAIKKRDAKFAEILKTREAEIRAANEKAEKARRKVWQEYDRETAR
jgi:hypothetical protein